MDHSSVFMPITSVFTSALVSARRFRASAGVCVAPPYPTMIDASFSDSSASFFSDSSAAPLSLASSSRFAAAFALGSPRPGAGSASAAPVAAALDSRADFAAAFSSASAFFALSSSSFTCGLTIRNFATVVSRMRMRFARASADWLGSLRLRNTDSTRWCMSRTHVIWMLSGSVASWTFWLNMYTVRRICASESSSRMWCTSSARKE